MDYLATVEPLKLKHMNHFVLRNQDDVDLFVRAHKKEVPGFLYSLTTRWIGEPQDSGSRFYEIHVNSYKMVQHGRKTTFGGAA